MRTVLSLLVMFCSLHFVYSQNESTIELNQENVFVSGKKDVLINTGSNGKAYYNNKELATKDSIRRFATVVVAASDASEKSKAGADYVCTGTGDENIIMAAMQSIAGKGGTCMLTEGTFILSSDIKMLNKIDLVGNGRDATFLKAYNSNGITSTYCFYTSFRNFALEGNPNQESVGITTTLSNGILFHNVKIQSFGSYGINLGGPEHRVSDCSIYNCKGTGIRLAGDASYSMINNTLIRNNGSGITLISGSDANIIAGNVIEGNVSDQGSSNLIESNIIRGGAIVRP